MGDTTPTGDAAPIEFKTKGGHVAKIKAFMTGYDDDAVKAVMMSDTNIKVKMKMAESHKKPRSAQQNAEEGDQADSNQEFEIPANKSIEARHKKIEVMVVELDGDETDILNRVQLLPVSEREEIIDKIDEIAKPLGTGEVEKQVKKALPPTMSAG